MDDLAGGEFSAVDTAAPEAVVAATAVDDDEMGRCPVERLKIDGGRVLVPPASGTQELIDVSRVVVGSRGASP